MLPRHSCDLCSDYRTGNGPPLTGRANGTEEHPMAGVDILATAFNGGNLAYLSDLYAKWVASPASVDASFSELFESLGDDAKAVLTDSAGASWAPRRFDVGEPEAAKPAAKGGKPAPAVHAAEQAALVQQALTLG
eukprot:gene4352-4400_t